MEAFRQTAILFVDMPGFGALVEEEGDDLGELKPSFLRSAPDHHRHQAFSNIALSTFIAV